MVELLPEVVKLGQDVSGLQIRRTAIERNNADTLTYINTHTTMTQETPIKREDLFKTAVYNYMAILKTDADKKRVYDTLMGYKEDARRGEFMNYLPRYINTVAMIKDLNIDTTRYKLPYWGRGGYEGVLLQIYDEQVMMQKISLV